MVDKIILQKNAERNCRKALQNNFNDRMIFSFDLYPKKKQKFRLISRIIFHMSVVFIQQYAYQSNDLYDIIFNLSCSNFLDEMFSLLLLYSCFCFTSQHSLFYILRTLSKHKKWIENIQRSSHSTFHRPANYYRHVSSLFSFVLVCNKTQEEPAASSQWNDRWK